MLRACVLALALALPGAPALADRVSSADAAEIRTVINRQIEAFKRDDAQGAFALASPGVQQAFRTPEKFLDAVRAAYRAVYRPAAVNFLELLVMGDDVVQQVQITDRAGTHWLAYYAMQRQRDGSWKANGCHLVPPVKTIPALHRIPLLNTFPA
jgi:hypothetical protein